jgi:N-acetylneuraminic acid mutarotase
MKRRDFLAKAIDLGAFSATVSLFPALAHAQFNAGATWKRGQYWKATSATNAPSARFDSVYCWTGTKLIVWGGGLHSGSTVAGDGKIYDPATDTWTTMSTTGAPSGRVGASGVWTGSKFIVWGGASNLNLHTPLNTGAVYDPGLDTWSAITATGAPAVRCYHSAVWTGTKMLVWGGYDWNTTDKSDGFSYDPSGNTWSAAIQTTGAPSARDTHMAVYTGSKMVIWGGEAYSGTAQNTGAVYDVAGNTWTAITATGAPTARNCWRNYVWTGSKVLLYGGDNGTVAMAGGYQYDPTGNTWSTMSATGAPSTRNYSMVIWNGTQLQLFGGANKPKTSTAAYNDGFFYNPSTDTWWPMRAGGVPGARDAGAAVWTGTQFIIWGGEASGQTADVATGGVYF